MKFILIDLITNYIFSFISIYDANMFDLNKFCAWGCFMKTGYTHRYIFIMSILLLSLTGCNNQNDTKNAKSDNIKTDLSNKLQKRIFDTHSMKSSRNYSRDACMKSCNDITESIDNILNNGGKVISSVSIERAINNDCSCVGTEYIVEYININDNKPFTNLNVYSDASPVDVIMDSAINTSLKKLLAGNFDKLDTLLNVSSGAVFNNGDLILEGCMKHNCVSSGARIYIKASGEIYAGLLEDEKLTYFTNDLFSKNKPHKYIQSYSDENKFEIIIANP